MNRNESILSLIGLCLRGRNLAVGEEPVDAVTRARDARVLLLASDAAEHTLRRAKRFAETGQCVWLQVPFTKQELGQATGRTAVAIAAITDIGLAVAVVRRLAELDPETYDEDLARLEMKAKRAKERKSEAAQHEKNLRRGIKRPKKKEGPAADPDAARPAQTRRGEPKQQAAHSKTPERPTRSLRKDGPRPARTGRARPKTKADPYAHSRPVKKGKGSFRKKEG